MVEFSRTTFGVTIAGEFSVAINDCGLFMKGVTLTPTFAGGCAQWEDSSTWSEGTKAGVMRMAMASMDALGDWFFWTWKVINMADQIEHDDTDYKFRRLLLLSGGLLNHLPGHISLVYAEVGYLKILGRLSALVETLQVLYSMVDMSHG
jgi:hypothetical protein